MSKIKSYLSLIKFSHTIFAMPFALIGFVLGTSSLKRIPWVKIMSSMIRTPWQRTKVFLFHYWFILVLVILCMIFARSAAMAFNRYLDRNFDAKNPRTAIREVPTGIISANNALIFTLISCILFVITCAFINRLCLYLSPVALFVVLGYSYTKRFTPFCHLILGLGLSLAPIGAYLAVTGSFSVLPVIFSFAVISWVSRYDIIYALH